MMFFFSGRRRHTRWPRDWSSDVCSSDLFWLRPWTPHPGDQGRSQKQQGQRSHGILQRQVEIAEERGRAVTGSPRSEERRVGKEGRSRWGPYQWKKTRVR